MTEEQRSNFLHIHSRLHDGHSTIYIRELPHDVQISSSQQSFIKFEDKVFIKLNPSSNGVYGRLAKAGHQITLIVRSGRKWGVIIDRDILDPEDGA
jgi:hypothetical protein